MNIGIWDLVLIYSLPVVVLGFVSGIFLAFLYVVVKHDLFRMDFSYDVLVGLKYRKRPLTLLNVAMLMIFDNGMQATLLYRVARWMYLHRLGQPALVLTKLSKFFTNMEVPPNVKAGRGLSLWHGTVISIGQFTDLGERCTIRQGVAISGFGKVKVGDDVSFSHGCFVIEGNPEPIVIGDGAVVAANAVVTKSVPPHHVAAGVPATKMIPLPPSPVEGIVFDLDGVLVDSGEATLQDLNETLGALGRKPLAGRRALKRARAMNLPRLLEKVLREGERKRGTELFLESFLRRCPERATLRAGVLETLEKLRAMGVRSGAFSRHFGASARELVTRCGLDAYVEAVVGADEIDEWKPHPKVITEVMRVAGIRRENALYVGGASPDLRFGNNAAIRVAVLPLAGETRKQLEKQVPLMVDNTVLDRMEEIPDLVLKTRGSEASSDSVSY